MKSTILIIIALWISPQVQGQVSQYDTYTPTPYEGYRMPIKEMMEGAAAFEARFERNRKYVEDLLDWVYKMKGETLDPEFKSECDTYVRKLRAFDGTNYADLTTEIHKVASDIKYGVSDYNNRLTAKKEAHDNYERLLMNADSKLQGGYFQDAIQLYNQVISQEPRELKAYRNRGIAYESLKIHTAAIQDLTRVIEENQTDATSYSNRGWARYYQGDYAGALSDFSNEVYLQPASGKAYFARATAKDELHDEVGAMADYNKAIELEPTHSMAYNNRGWAKFTQKKYANALVDLNKAILLDNQNSVAFDSRQETKFALNDMKGCEADCKAAIAIDPKLANSHLFLGRVYYKQGKKQYACEEWTKADLYGNTKATEYINKYCK
jgi:tetratricopeptide (TPR) repeat protein